MAVLALQSASTGLSALNTRMDVIANNLANVNTEGFKTSRANFQDLLYVEREQPGVENAYGDQKPTGLYVGLGVRVSGTQQDFKTGAPIDTGRDLDLMIEGNGFFKVTVPDTDIAPDSIAYSRAGNFTLDADGRMVLANSNGRVLEPQIDIPPDAISVSIDRTGIVSVLQPGSTTPTQVGQIETATFINPAGLKQVGENLWVETPASGAAIEGNPGEENRGGIKQHYLESSNVDPTRELIELIRTQRAFEMNSQSIRAADDTLQTVAQLRR